jgi:hypothetical protein
MVNLIHIAQDKDLQWAPVNTFSLTDLLYLLIVKILLHLVIYNLTHTHTHGRTPLDEKSVRRSGLYLHNTQNLQGTNIHAPADSN